MIAVVDSGVANLASVMAALDRLEVQAEVTADAAKIRAASHVIVPGVGSAAAAMKKLKAKNLDEVLCQLTQPVLGICLGMQLLFQRSDESGGTDCLGILPGDIKLLPSSSDHPVPHMGWNRLKFQTPRHPLLRGVDDGSFVYFVHSYAAPSSQIAVATTEYGQDFSAIVGDRNFFGCQFHPERSSVAGQKILSNFIGL